jgi:competence/damage-inducible protein CinA-like protein
VVTILINTGTELMLGRVLNTHQQWLCRHLADWGYPVSRQLAVPDTAREIVQAIRQALAEADLIVTTGGLGPTSDDVTRDVIAETLGRKLREDPAILANLQAFFAARRRLMPDRVRLQAQVPEGALVLPNSYGTAPGLAIEISPNPARPGHHPTWIVMLPGPPRELRPMFLRAVVPLLRRVLPKPEGFACRTLSSMGLGESWVEERLCAALEKPLADGLELGYCARPGQVDVRLVCRGTNAKATVEAAEEIVRAELGEHIYSDGEQELEEVVLQLLKARGQTLALAESCTGGLLAHRLTNVPGASAVLLAGIVSYSNQAKQAFLGVDAETLAQHGAVSEPVVREMAEGARRRTGADYALAITGIAGPGGGTPDKPTGTVFIGLAGPFQTVVIRNLNAWDRETFKQVTTDQALDLLRLKLRQPS